MNPLTPLEKELINVLRDTTAMLDVYSNPAIHTYSDSYGQAKSALRKARAALTKADYLAQEAQEPVRG